MICWGIFLGGFVLGNENSNQSAGYRRRTRPARVPFGEVKPLRMPIIQQNPYATLTAAIEELKNEGYTEDFNNLGEHLECKGNGKNYQPSDFTIEHTYRFEGMTNPSDNSVLYGIEANDGTKGLLVDAYGVYADALSPEMIEKFRVDYEDPDEV